MTEDRLLLKFLHDAFYYYLLSKGDSREHLQVTAFVLSIIDYFFALLLVHFLLFLGDHDHAKLHVKTKRRNLQETRKVSVRFFGFNFDVKLCSI